MDAIHTGWLQLVLQGGAMVLLAVIVVKAPQWLDSLITRVTHVTSEQLQVAISSFAVTLRDMRSDLNGALQRQEASFLQRADMLRQTFENKTDHLRVELQELSRKLDARLASPPLRPESSHDSSD
jgi:hypothetical protein